MARKRRPGGGRKQTVVPDLPPMSTDDSVPLGTRVYTCLRMALMSGVLAPGVSLTSRSLSAVLGVSQTPIRDALKRLEAEGAVYSRSQSAFYVNDPDQKEFADITEIRLRLETLAIEKAAEVWSSEDTERLKKMNDAYRTLMARGGEDAGKSLVPNFRFHFEIYRRSGAPILVQLIESNWLRIGPVFHRFILPTDNRKNSIDAHLEIIDALTARDPKAAAAALRKDLLSAYEDIYPQLPKADTQAGKVPENSSPIPWLQVS